MNATSCKLSEPGIWSELGTALRQSAIEAHGEPIALDFAWGFLLENPEIFSDSDEWPDDMPTSAPAEVADAYYAEESR